MFFLISSTFFIRLFFKFGNNIIFTSGDSRWFYTIPAFFIDEILLLKMHRTIERFIHYTDEIFLMEKPN